jgi:hypothetical protein
MSKNAANKRRAKRHHRDAFSRFPRGTSLAFLIGGVEPVSTPLMDMLRTRAVIASYDCDRANG